MSARARPATDSKSPSSAGQHRAQTAKGFATAELLHRARHIHSIQPADHVLQTFLNAQGRAGEAMAAIVSLLISARLNGHDSYAYLRDVLQRLPTQPTSRIDELLAPRWLAP